ncbi:J domain-containing protein [Pseudolysinimonas sp.]|uniref:J domain-containing protein n=1 Tax=Pseudolysinimonas sp. TaxID=2680009 RepID=UPI0037836E67
MPSPLALSPYTVLGVAPTASEAELRRAYRVKLRETHPDTGGSAVQFHRVQRAWEQVGTAEARAAYDSGTTRSGGSDEPERTFAPPAPAARTTSRPQARTHGHPGGWYREQYLDLLQEWVGRGAAIPNPYDPQLVRSAPREIQHLLASAIAEEDTAVVLAGLGIGFTIWNDVRTDPGRRPENGLTAGPQGAAGKIDHIALGPSGLWAMLSEDWGSSVSTKRGEVIGAGLARDERPFAELAGRARRFEKEAKVRFTALAIVVPDGAAPEGVVAVGSIRGAKTFLVERPRLANLVGTRASGVSFGGTDHFEVRTRVQAAARFV